MVKRWFLVFVAAVLGMAGLSSPASAAAPTGCTTSIQWVQQGSNYWDGLGSVQCTSGRYKAKEICINNQTGSGYVLYGTQVVNAPAAATVLCYTGNSARAVYAVTDPPDAGVTGCVGWSEWVSQGSNLFWGRGQAQCDTGRYRAKVLCRNEQSGDYYILFGYQTVTAPAAVSLTCNTGNTAQTVQAVADPPATGLAGCMTWSAWIVQGSSLYYGRGSAQCDSGRFQARLACHNVQTGQDYVVYGPVVTGPATSVGECQYGNSVTAVTAQAA
ncbi:hypothetical protein [Amycolatopsis sp. Hca4]|uniref:hypothetical protein n=1 Tax=Amycolatopsis sp. Hca4 TaxID=2742131 RepID=UPI0015906879|nr:hypothetical protein [Amycolatopsis sp. Hca4]QKV73789.1 hypothetical protein HUT10_08405 [Amycolatopsis sp. Hca4]